MKNTTPKVNKWIGHLALGKKNSLPEGFLSLGVIPQNLLPFDSFEQDRTLSGSITLGPSDYTRSGADDEMGTADGRYATIRVGVTLSADHYIKPTNFLADVVDFHQEDETNVGNPTTYVANRQMNFPIQLAANEYFVKFLDDPYTEDRSIRGVKHSWVPLSSKSFVTMASVRYDGKGNDKNHQGLKLQLAMRYRVRVVIGK